MIAVQQLSFDFDELTRPSYAGLRVGFHSDHLTVAQAREIEEQARRDLGGFGIKVGHPHIWFVDGYNSCLATPGHEVDLGDADLSCSCAPHLACSCIGGRVYRAFCSCHWTSPVFADEGEAVAGWHDHAWPGWRDLPVVPHNVRPPSGGITKKTKAALAWVEDRYPAGFQTAGAPIVTQRAYLGTRCVPGYSPWGGYDISSTVLGGELFERAVA
jgi:hypothetical protein